MKENSTRHGNQKWYGLVSRDAQSILLDPERQKEYWEEVRERYDTVYDRMCERVKNGDAAGDLEESGSILISLRKLREALVATRAKGEFVVQIYSASARMGILACQPESYLPALLKLVYSIEQNDKEFRLCYLAHLLCRTNELSEYYALAYDWKIQDLHELASSIIDNNCIRYLRILDTSSPLLRSIIQTFLPTIQEATRASIHRAFYKLPLDVLEQMTGTESFGSFPWQIIDNDVIIKQYNTNANPMHQLTNQVAGVKIKD